MSRDRGTYVNKNEALFEEDCGQYAQVEDVFAGCGASMLIRSATLVEVGNFDEDFFMYYEDTDFCWRARLLDWIVLYAPEAIVRHIHCGTTQEWSRSFVYLTERNRLAMVSKNGSCRQVLRVWSGFLLNFMRLGWTSIVSVAFLRSDWRNYAGQLWTQTQVLVTLIKWQPRLWKRRFDIQGRRRVTHQTIETWFRE